jgi:hypothetical protein
VVADSPTAAYKHKLVSFCNPRHLADLVSPFTLDAGRVMPDSEGRTSVLVLYDQELFSRNATAYSGHIHRVGAASAQKVILEKMGQRAA